MTPASLWILLSVLPVETKQSVAVLDMKPDGGADPVVARQLTARLAEAVAARRHLSVLAPDDFRAMLDQEAKKQALGCTDESCLAELAGAMGADLLVAGRVSKIDEGYALSLSLLNATEAKALARASETWAGESIQLLELIPPMVDRLFADEGAEPTGALEIQGAPGGARILIDGQVRGTAPAGRMAEIPVGARKLEELEEDHRPIQRWVIIQTDKTTTVQVVAEALESITSKWWFWTVAGVAVVGAGVGTAVALSGGGGDAGPGLTGVNVSTNATDSILGDR